MIKIVEIKGGLKEYHKNTLFPFKEKSRIWEEKTEPNLYKQLRGNQTIQRITRADLESAMGFMEPRDRQNEMVIHASAEGHRLFQEALQTEAARQLEEIERRERERERDRETRRTVEMLRSLPIYFGTSGESANRYAYGVDPYRPSFTEPPIRSLDPETGNTVVTQGSHSATFSRDMTEEQMIAYFDSLD